MGRPTLIAYGHLLWAQVRGQAQYRVSFAIDLVGSVAFGLLDVVTVIVLFRVSRTLAGFAFAEVFLMTALASCAFALADLLVGNVERLRFYVRTGLFDAVLVRPLGALIQLVAMDVAPRRVGRIAVGIALVGFAAAQAGIALTPGRLALLVVAPIAGAVIFSAVFVATAAVAFWWIESGELGNALTYGGPRFHRVPDRQSTAPLFRRLFAYALGFAFVAYYPALALLDRRDPLGRPNTSATPRPWWRWWPRPRPASCGARASGTTGAPDRDGHRDARASPRLHEFASSRGWLRRETRVIAAVDGIDLSVERGETLGYIGPNGAGKSTTLKMFTGVLYPSGGTRARLRAGAGPPAHAAGPPHRRRLRAALAALVGLAAARLVRAPAPRVRRARRRPRRPPGAVPAAPRPGRLRSTCPCGSCRSASACAAN